MCLCFTKTALVCMDTPNTNPEAASQSSVVFGLEEMETQVLTRTARCHCSWIDFNLTEEFN